MRSFDLGNHPDRHATLVGRRLKLGMSEQPLNHANVRTALQQMGREAVAKPRWLEALVRRERALERLNSTP